MKTTIKRLARLIGYDIIQYRKFPISSTQEDIEIIRKVASYTMTTPERLLALINAVRYIVNNNISGDLVECGVWRGGSMMAMALTLLKLNVQDRELYLYDTFEGMPKPTAKDFIGQLSAFIEFDKNKISADSSNWCYASLKEVKTALYSTKYPTKKIHFLKGKVENTIPKTIPNQIAILRLDTDFYESTYHELIHLFPRLVRGGVLILDDYGSWTGSKQATDEYISQNKIKILLNSIDKDARIAVKL